MDKILNDFILALRSSGNRVSVSESIDAMSAAELIGYDDREAFKDSLSAVLAKTFYEKEIFEECFEKFFSCDTFSKEETSTSSGSVSEPFQGSPPLVRMLLSNDIAGLSTSIREAAREININQIMFFSQRGIYTQRILRHMGFREMLEEVNRLYREDTSSSREMARRLEIGRGYLFKNVKKFVEQQIDLFSGSAIEELVEHHLRNIKLSDLDKTDLHHMHAIIRKMVKRLNDLHSRRKKVFKRGQLDFMKTLRKNVTYQGMLFDIKWKKKKVDRPNIVAICDVSRSVQAVSKFLLLFLCSLNKDIARIRTFIFCSNLVEVSQIFEDYPVEEAIAKIQSGKGLGIMLASTDYGQALRDLEKSWSHIITHKTTVLILGDARNNYGDPETGILRSIHERCKRLLWLNPEPRSFWGIGDSEMKRYLPCCHLAKECNTVNHLARVVDSLL